jgi:regulator of replication initiation timing
MINAKLDTRFNNFLAESKQKIQDVGKEIELLGSENSVLEQQVSSTFHQNAGLNLDLKKLEEQLKRFKDLHSINTNEVKLLKQRVDKAKKDMENLASAYKTQAELAQTEKKKFLEKEKRLRFERKANEEIFKENLLSLDMRIEELKNEIMLKGETNQALVMELNNSDNIESEILSSIKAELMSLASISSQSFYKPRRSK